MEKRYYFHIHVLNQHVIPVVSTRNVGVFFMIHLILVNTFPKFVEHGPPFIR